MTHMDNYVITENGELYHYGVPGMRWGVRRSRMSKGIVAAKPKGDRGNWGRDPMTKRKQKWLDDNGFNPNRPYGTKPGIYNIDAKALQEEMTTPGQRVARGVKRVAIASGLTVGALAVAHNVAIIRGAREAMADIKRMMDSN